MEDVTLKNYYETVEERSASISSKNKQRGNKMKKANREVPICLNCKNNSADSPNFEVKCYWKKHENLDVGDTCKYFDRGSTNIIIPVNHCFKLTILADALLLYPAYAVSHMGHDCSPSIQLGEEEQGKTLVWYLYDANVDLIIDNNFPVTTLKRFLEEHDGTRHCTITGAMERRYPAMMDARRIIEQRTKKKAA